MDATLLDEARQLGEERAIIRQTCDILTKSAKQLDAKIDEFNSAVERFNSSKGRFLEFVGRVKDELSPELRAELLDWMK